MTLTDIVRLRRVLRAIHWIVTLPVVVVCAVMLALAEIGFELVNRTEP